jgi:hypothetical protein
MDSINIKTPCPDITIGLSHGAVVGALEACGVVDPAADSMLEVLQSTLLYPSQDSPPRPVLCSRPTERNLSLHSPFLIVEGKSIATGQTVYDAQNQAAVAGSCALNILNGLADLAAHLDGHVSDVDTASPMVFSICTQGPYHELWVHYTTMENGLQQWNMNMVKVCHGSFQDGVLEFLVAVDNVMRWGTSDFLKGIAKQLGAVAKSAATTTQG